MTCALIRSGNGASRSIEVVADDGRLVVTFYGLSRAMGGSIVDEEKLGD